MAEIRVVSRSEVHARIGIKEQRIDLSPCDLMLLTWRAIQRGLVFPKPKPSDKTFVQHLKNSLSRTLDFFFPLAGRLSMVEHDDEISVSIECNNQGAQFVHAVADHVTIADILNPVYVPPFLHSFFPLDGLRNCQGVSNPLLGVQVTELVDGVFIGCTMNHAVADGSSFWHFLNSWSEISRGLHHISNPPVFDRSLFLSPIGDDFCFPIRIPKSLSGLQIDDHNRIKSTQLAPMPVKTRVLHFPKSEITELKAKANAEAGDVNISSLQSLLTHIWRSALLQTPGVDPEEHTFLLLPVEIRSRLEPSLPGHYFGNAVNVGDANIILKGKDMMVRENGFGYGALQVNKAVTSLTPDKLRRSLKNWIQNPEQIASIGSSSVPTVALTVISSPRFNVYGNDFGWGKPIAVRSRPLQWQLFQVLTLFPGVEEEALTLKFALEAYWGMIPSS